MNLQRLRDFCLSKPGVTEEFPFGPDTLVFKVMGKMFAATGVVSPVSVNLKCDPERALELRASHEDVQPGYHMNKRHWNTVSLIGRLSDAFLEELVEHSYDLVVSSLPKRVQAELRGV